MSRRDWVSAHIFYHDSLDDLLNGAVRPLVAELRRRDLIERSFFIRYWQAGPHVRLRLLPKVGVDDATICESLDGTIGAFLSSRPSRTVIREEDYLQVARPLSMVGRGRDAIDPLQPNNSVRYLPYEPEYARYGGTTEAMEVVERHFSQSSDIALDVVAAGGSHEHRVGQALAMMFVCSAVACDGDPEDVMRFLETGRRVWGSRLALGRLDRQEARFEERFQRQRQRLHDLVGRLREMVVSAETRETAEPVSRWLSSVRVLKERLLSLEDDGLFKSAEQLISGGSSEDRAGIKSVLLLCSHMNNNRLGLTLTEEAYLMFLLWRTVTAAAEEAGD